MKNAIKYFYNLEINDIHQYKKEYKFHVLNKEYILCPYMKTLNELEEKYSIQKYINSIGIYCHKIISNNMNQLITKINNKNYVLIEITQPNRKINIIDIMEFSKVYLNRQYFKNIDRTNWKKLWENKIDYLEYQINQFRKTYPTIRESSDYYIGIAETCISLFANIESTNQITTYMHNRINDKTTANDYYNPLNFIIDSRIRDIGEYLTPKLYENQDIIGIIDNYINLVKLTNNEIILLFIRLMYPSNYFDLCESIIEKEQQESVLKSLLDNNNIFEKQIKEIYLYIKKIITIPEIEWLSSPIQH